MSTRTAAQQDVLARTQAARRARIDAQIEDLEFLLGVGTPLEDALDRVGWTPGAAEKALRRRSHPLATAVTKYAARAARARRGA